jgi:hypothetical protein
VRQLQFVGLTDDHQGLVFTDSQSTAATRYVIPIDEALLGVVAELTNTRRARPTRESAAALPVPAPEEEMPSAGPRTGAHRLPTSRPLFGTMTPREIQARLRAGRSVADVAAEAGVEEAWVERFAPPILAEQAAAIDRAGAMTYVTARRGPSGRSLAESVRRNLLGKGVRPDDEQEWSAFLHQSGEWVVRFRYRHRRRTTEAEWLVDLAAGTLVALNTVAGTLAFVPPTADGQPDLAAIELEGREADRAAPPRSAGSRAAAGPRPASSRTAVPRTAVPRAATKSTAVPRAATKSTAVPRAATSRTAVSRAATKSTAVPRAATSRTAVPRAATDRRPLSPSALPPLDEPGVGAERVAAARRSTRAVTSPARPAPAPPPRRSTRTVQAVRSTVVAGSTGVAAAAEVARPTRAPVTTGVARSTEATGTTGRVRSSRARDATSAARTTEAARTTKATRASAPAGARPVPVRAAARPATPVVVPPELPVEPPVAVKVVGPPRSVVPRGAAARVSAARARAARGASTRRAPSGETGEEAHQPHFPQPGHRSPPEGDVPDGAAPPGPVSAGPLASAAVPNGSTPDGAAAPGPVSAGASRRDKRSGDPASRRSAAPARPAGRAAPAAGTVRSGTVLDAELEDPPPSRPKAPPVPPDAPLRPSEQSRSTTPTRLRRSRPSG